MTRLTDPPIRAALQAQLSVGLEAPDRVLFEMPLCGGLARVDVARLNGHLEGYEIKSDADTLARLANQREIYDRVVDRMTLVTTERHAHAATRLIPGWWGLWTAAAAPEGAVTLSEHRAAASNPNREAVWVAQLLWREEALELLLAAGVEGVGRAPRRVLWRKLADVYQDLDGLADLVREILKRREDWLPAG